MSSLGSPKIIPRIHLSPKIKQRVRNQHFKTFSHVSPKKFSPKRKNRNRSPVKIVKDPFPTGGSVNRAKSPTRSKLFLTQREKFRTKPTVNPVTNRNIKIDGDTYNKLVKIYGNPY